MHRCGARGVLHVFFLISSLVTLTMAQAQAQSSPITVIPDGPKLTVSQGGQTLLTLDPMFWGPNWAFSGVRGQFQAEGDKAVLRTEGKLNRSDLPYTLEIEAAAQGNVLKVDYTLTPQESGKAGILAVGFAPGQPYNGEDALRYEAAESGTITLPVPRGGIGDGVKSFAFGEGDDAVNVQLAGPTDVSGDGGVLRIMLGSDEVSAEPMKVGMNIELPGEIRLFRSIDDVPKPENWDQWFEWTAESNTAVKTVIDMTDWLEAPAGKHGWVEMREDDLIYNEEILKVWGLNNAFAATAPEKEIADKRAAFYAKYGINCVRLHKIADGVGWAGIQSQDSAAEYDPEGLDRLDYYVAKLREKGIFVKISVSFGSPNLGPADVKHVPYLEELGELKGRNAKRLSPGGGSIFWSPEMRKVRTLQITNLLNHENPYTGTRYADDPAVMIVEMTNEESALFFSSISTMLKHERFYTWTGRKFAQWLKEKYGTKQALLEAWGQGGLNSFGETKMVDESWEEEFIIPFGNPWFWDPENLETSQKAKKPRLLDAMVFLGELQTEAYREFEKAIRDTGYKGLVMSSNWQAGSNFSHYTNLWSDAQIGLVDRHNYYNATSMLQTPGSGMLSAGMQQVINRPFSLSEWIHTPPSLLGVEGPAIIGAYGMGLNGWDISYLFQNRDQGEFSDTIFGDRWDVVSPVIMGAFPTIARHVLRDDVAESEVPAKRNVYVPDLGKGELDFRDTLKMDYDIKSLDSDKVPARSLAVARAVVDFVDEPTPTPEFDLEPYTEAGTLVSATKQLRWTPREAYDQKGYFTMDTPATKAVVGFAKGLKNDLGGIGITSQSEFATIYITAPGPEESLESAKSWIVQTIARAMNQDMVYYNHTVLKKGNGPIVMEPVHATITLPANRSQATVHILDHDGRRTGETIPVENGQITLNGAKTQAVYYEITF